MGRLCAIARAKSMSRPFRCDSGHFLLIPKSALHKNLRYFWNGPFLPDNTGVMLGSMSRSLRRKKMNTILQFCSLSFGARHSSTSCNLIIRHVVLQPPCSFPRPMAPLFAMLAAVQCGEVLTLGHLHRTLCGYSFACLYNDRWPTQVS